MSIQTSGDLITLKDDKWLENQRHAGRCVGRILNVCDEIISSATTSLSLKDLENKALEIMKEMDCFPTFKGYRGFPSAICTSVNNQVVHGVVTDYVLQEGDVVSVDLGATYNGAIADAAVTSIYGEAKSRRVIEMLDACEEALDAGIKAINVGKRLGVIGNAIYKSVKDTDFGLIVDYGGHGIDFERPHAPPFVSNKASTTDGPRIQPGLSIAIEPMLIFNRDTKTRVDEKDGWTVWANDIACHFEHSVFVHEDEIEILTESREY